MNREQRMIGWILRFLGVAGMFAMGAVVMPFAWMLKIHEFLGLGIMPEAPVVEYLARSLSVFYALVAVVFWYLSFRVREHWGLIRMVGFLLVGFGVISTGINITSQMPTLWTLQEAPPMILVGLVVLWLHRRGRLGETDAGGVAS